jgi:hypothetical protein
LPSVEETPGDRAVEPVSAEEKPRLTFTVVGMGASAGGLEAFTEFFQAMPHDSGMAFVLVQHLPPDRESMIPEILSKQTKMTVQQVRNGMRVLANHVYVIRPGHTLTIRDGALHLGEHLEKPRHEDAAMRHPPWQRALSSRQRVVLADAQGGAETAHTSTAASRRSAAAAAGYRAVVSTPLRTRRDAILGALSAYFDEPHTRPNAISASSTSSSGTPRTSSSGSGLRTS